MSGEGDSRWLNGKTLWLIVASIVLILGAIGGYLALQKQGDGKIAEPESTQMASTSPSSESRCRAILDRVRDYGVVPFNSSLSGDPEGKQTDSGKIECMAESGDKNFSLIATVSCDDFADQKCLDIYRVSQSDGSILYQKRPYSF